MSSFTEEEDTEIYPEEEEPVLELPAGGEGLYIV